MADVYAMYVTTRVLTFSISTLRMKSNNAKQAGEQYNQTIHNAKLMKRFQNGRHLSVKRYKKAQCED